MGSLVQFIGAAALGVLAAEIHIRLTMAAARRTVATQSPAAAILSAPLRVLLPASAVAVPAVWHPGAGVVAFVAFVAARVVLRRCALRRLR